MMFNKLFVLLQHSF